MGYPLHHQAHTPPRTGLPAASNVEFSAPAEPLACQQLAWTCTHSGATVWPVGLPICSQEACAAACCPDTVSSHACALGHTHAATRHAREAVASSCPFAGLLHTVELSAPQSSSAANPGFTLMGLAKNYLKNYLISDSLDSSYWCGAGEAWVGQLHSPTCVCRRHALHPLHHGISSRGKQQCRVNMPLVQKITCTPQLNPLCDLLTTY
jgi:hypothetical protein